MSSLNMFEERFPDAVCAPAAPAILPTALRGGRRLRIVFFSEVWEPQANGVAVTLRHVITHLRAQGHELLFVVPRSRSCDRNQEFVTLRCLPLPFYPEMPVILPHWSFHRREMQRIEDFQPDLVHVWTPGVMSFFGLRWARIHGCAVVGSYETDLIRYVHSYGFGWSERIVWGYLRWLYMRCCKTFVPSADTQSFLEGSGLRDVEVFPRGVDSQAFHPSKRDLTLRNTLGAEGDEMLVLYAGRLAQEKNLPMLMRAFLRLVGRRPKARLVLAGDGPLESSLARKFKHPAITFVGVKRGEELCRLFASADIFALPSSTETLSLATLEAMASGTPALSMNAGGVRTILRHMETGLLADSKEDFADLLLRLADDPDLRARLSVNARQFAEAQSWSAGLSGLEHSYQEVVAGYAGLVQP